ncbi:MAG: hypothetical protein FJ253_09865 [Phycisphaerae bacterium]|nr:hypothetical protein [Phycisphaerae bacterium]
MAVIKQGRTVAVVGEGRVLDLRDLERQSRDVLDRARADAERIRASAANESQRLVEERSVSAYREGFERGLVDGREQGAREGREAALAAAKEEIDSLVREWSTALDVFRSRRQELLEGLSREAVRLGVEIGRRLVHAAPRGDADLAAEQAARALEMLGSPGEAILLVHPEDRAAVERHLAPLAHRLASGEVRLVDDASVGRGGCVARAAGGEVDASVEPMIDRVADILLGPLPEEVGA